MARTLRSTVVLDGGRVVPAGTPEDDELAELITNDAAWSGERDEPSGDDPPKRRSRRTAAKSTAKSSSKSAAEGSTGSGEGEATSTGQDAAAGSSGDAGPTGDQGGGDDDTSSPS